MPHAALGGNMSTLLLLTGGTIDAEPYEHLDQPDATVITSYIPQLLEDNGLCNQVEIHYWKERKDSKLFLEDEIREIATYIMSSKYNQVVVTHGTDRMAEHSRIVRQELLANKSKAHLKTVIFTGAMIPLSHGKESDGESNLQHAIEMAATQAPGVYVAMHGQLFDALTVTKNFDQKKFIQN